MAYLTYRRAVILEREVGRRLASAFIHLLVLLLQGWNYSCIFFLPSPECSQPEPKQCYSMSGCSVGVYFWEGENRGRVMISCFSILGDFTCSPHVCHCYSAPIAALTQPPFTELAAVLSLIQVREIFLSCDKKACLWFAGESLDAVAMTSCCKNGAILSPSSKPMCIKGESAKVPFS